MDRVEWLWSLLDSRRAAVMVHGAGGPLTGADLLNQANQWAQQLTAAGVKAGDVVAFDVQDQPPDISLFLALMRLAAVAVPVGRSQQAELVSLLGISHADVHVTQEGPTLHVKRCPPPAQNPLLESLRSTGHAGLVVFSSGSTGQPKAILHDFERVLRKFKDVTRAGYRTLQFLPFHHFGGVNTLLSTLCFQGVVVLPAGKSAAAVARTIQEAKVELLPTTPSFLNLLLASGLHKSCDLSSVKLVTYGAEVTPAGLLERIQAAFPGARFQQTYGLSELGVLRTRSKDSGSLWLKVGGEGYQVREKDLLLQVRTDYAMLGYLNAPSPFDADGWMNTGDSVEVDGEWIHILGRASDMINVGGEKVFPAEVEATLLQAENVVEAACYGEKDPFLGARVVARVVLAKPEDPDDMKTRLRLFCRTRLDRFKIPVRFEVVQSCIADDGFKKKRQAVAGKGG